MHSRLLTPIVFSLLVADALFPASATRAQSQREPEEIGVSGYVLAADGIPVSGGTVMIQSPGVRTTASIGSTGRFRVVPHAPGDQQIFVSVSGLAPYRVSVSVPASRILTLPVIRLSPATYFRVRFVSSAGEPITSPRLLRRSLDAGGNPIPEWPDGRGPDQIDSDGTTTLGPLPRGVTTLVLNSPPFAQTRLPNLQVTGDATLVDGGTVIVEPGAVLSVDVVDGAGVPMVAHDVHLEDTAPLSPLGLPPARTNEEGRATFDRLAAGRYRVLTRAAGPCGARPLLIERAISVSGTGTPRVRIVAGGSATFRLSSSLGPLRAASITASPESTSPPPSPPLPGRFDVSSSYGRSFLPFFQSSSCSGATDANGRVTLPNFPPGPARLEVRLLNSTWVGRVQAPSPGQELAIEIPGGYLPLRVMSARTGDRVAGASITWTAGGARVEAASSASGEALLEGVAAAPGTLEIRRPGFLPAEGKFMEPPDVLYEVALMPAPDPNLRVRVIAASGEPLPNAVVELTPENPLQVGRVAATDAKGVVSFFDRPPGALRLTARADRFVIAGTRVATDIAGEVVLTLSRGYRAIANVESSMGAGQHLIRIVNEAGASVDGLLDVASDRGIEPPGRISLGPLAPGTYLVLLHGPRGQWQERVHIVDRDVHVTFR